MFVNIVSEFKFSKYKTVPYAQHFIDGVLSNKQPVKYSTI